MNELMFYNYFLIIFAILGILAFIALLFIPAPYGKLFNEKFGYSLPGKWAWLIMESPAAITMLILFVIALPNLSLVPIVLFSLFLVHYFPRDFIYPFWAKRRNRTPIFIMIFAIFFNISNAYIQGRWLAIFAPKEQYSISWLYSPQFIIGLILFVGGYIFNRQSEFILRKLRIKDEKNKVEYYIPHGGLFKFVSCANYFAEIIEWIGWAIATWSFAGLVFAMWTLANLMPRALAYHKWYKEKFEHYPKNRKAIIPFIL